MSVSRVTQRSTQIYENGKICNRELTEQVLVTCGNSESRTKLNAKTIFQSSLIKVQPRPRKSEALRVGRETPWLSEEVRESHSDRQQMSGDREKRLVLDKMEVEDGEGKGDEKGEEYERDRKDEEDEKGGEDEQAWGEARTRMERTWRLRSVASRVGNVNTQIVNCFRKSR